MLLKGQTALVTGAAGGIGTAIARLLAAEGADLILWDLAPLEPLAEELAGEGRKISVSEVNIADPDKVATAARKIEAEEARLDILVNNAGITRDNLLFRMKDEEWDQVIKVNLYGAFHCTRVLSRWMAKKRGGSIINLASIIGLRGNAGQANYAASKAGLIGLTKSSARELARFQIRVNAIAPGYIRTPMTERLNEKQRDAIQAMIPLQTLGTPEDVAGAVLFLASPLARYITGEVLKVDGGFAM